MITSVACSNHTPAESPPESPQPALTHGASPLGDSYFRSSSGVVARMALSNKIKVFTAKGTKREKEARDVMNTAPGVVFVTAEVVLSGLGDASRFRNDRGLCA